MKYLLAGNSDLLEGSVLVDGDNLEVVKEFCYLGTVVTSDNDISSEIRRRIIQGNRAYYGFHRLLRSRRLQARTKCEIHRTLIRPVVLYGHESWTIRVDDASALGVFERRILRIIFRGVFEHGAWRKRMNHELAELYGEPSILAVAKADRIRLLGYVMRMPDSCPTKKVFDSNPQFGKRRRGALLTRWLDQVKRDLAEIGCLHG